jgi:hypothetical protein
MAPEVGSAVSCRKEWRDKRMVSGNFHCRCKWLGGGIAQLV